MRYDVEPKASNRTFAIIAKLLDGNDTPGVDDEYFFDVPMKDFAVTLWWEGNPTGIVVDLEGSIDGEHWISLSKEQTFTEPGLLVAKGPVMAIRMRYVKSYGSLGGPPKLYADCVAVR